MRNSSSRGVYLSHRHSMKQNNKIILYALGALFFLTVVQPAPAFAAFRVDGHTNIDSDGSGPVLTLTTTQPNDIIVVHEFNESNGASIFTVSSITDSDGLHWQMRSATTTPNDLVLGQGAHTSAADNEVWWALAASPLSNDTITINLSGTSDCGSAVAFGVTGANTSSPWDSNGSLPAEAISVSGSTPSVSGISTTNAGSLIFGFMGSGAYGSDDSGALFFSGSGYSMLDQNVVLNTNNCNYASDAVDEYQVVSTTQSNISAALGGTIPHGDGWFMVGDAIQAASGGSGQTVIFLTSGTTWTVPSDWNSSNNTIETIGGGGGGGWGGGGGAGGDYCELSNFSTTAGANISYAIGAAGTGGTSSSHNGAAGATTTFNGASLVAPGGGGGISGGAGGAPGTDTTGTCYAGGSGGNFAGGTGVPGGGGGGAGGPFGVGGNGGGPANGYGGDGGGGNGGGTNGSGLGYPVNGSDGGNSIEANGGVGATAGASPSPGSNGSFGSGGGGGAGSQNANLTSAGGNGGNGVDWDPPTAPVAAVVVAEQEQAQTLQLHLPAARAACTAVAVAAVLLSQIPYHQLLLGPKALLLLPILRQAVADPAASSVYAAASVYAVASFSGSSPIGGCSQVTQFLNGVTVMVSLVYGHIRRHNP